MTKRISEGLRKAVSYLKANWEWILMFAFGIIAGIVTGVKAYMNFDTVPATAADYEPLKKQLVSIQENPDILLTTDCKITVKDKIITVTVSNKECNVTVEYDESFNVISTTEADYSIHWLLIGILSFIGGVFASFIACLIYLVIWESILKLSEWLKSKFTKEKPNIN